MLHFDGTEELTPEKELNKGVKVRFLRQSK